MRSSHAQRTYSQRVTWWLSYGSGNGWLWEDFFCVCGLLLMVELLVSGGRRGVSARGVCLCTYWPRAVFRFFFRFFVFHF